MGRGLVRQLAAEGCHVATCDIFDENLEETKALVECESSTVRVTTHHCDVGIEADVKRFAKEVAEQQETDQLNLLFNNAGVGGGGSFVAGDRRQWERTFDICWWGVYWNAREFLPMMLRAKEGHIINTSSVNGFWASLGPGVSHTAYSAAKFAVKGFSESLITDLRINAPHIKVSVVMPGHIGTSIGINSGRVHGSDEMTDEQVQLVKDQMIARGQPVDNESLDQIRERMKEMRNSFQQNAPTSADQAATIMLNAVKDERWRVLVGDDAKRLDERVRSDPETVYSETFSMLTSI